MSKFCRADLFLTSSVQQPQLSADKDIKEKDEHGGVGGGHFSLKISVVSTSTTLEAMCFVWPRVPAWHSRGSFRTANGNRVSHLLENRPSTITSSTCCCNWPISISMLLFYSTVYSIFPDFQGKVFCKEKRVIFTESKPPPCSPCV